MIYESKERAEEVAKMLNDQQGYPPARAVPTEHGWTVISSYRFTSESEVS
jgi:hypothetical protein